MQKATKRLFRNAPLVARFVDAARLVVVSMAFNSVLIGCQNRDTPAVADKEQADSAATPVKGKAQALQVADEGKETVTLNGHTGEVLSVAFSADGKRLASASGDATVKMWDAVNGQETLTFKGFINVATCVAFSADGKRLASAGDLLVKVWDTTSGQETLTLKGHTSWVNSVAFSPDGKWLASAGGSDPKNPSKSGEVKIWDAANGQELLTLKGHTGATWSVAFTTDGKRLASASADQTVKVWDVTTELLSNVVDEVVSQAATLGRMTPSWNLVSLATSTRCFAASRVRQW